MPFRLLVPVTAGKCVSAPEDAGEREKNCARRDEIHDRCRRSVSKLHG